MKNNISSIQDCYGCGVCAVSCSKNIIKIELNKDGFYEPIIIDDSTCTKCGVCTDVCAFSHNDLAMPSVAPIKSWAAWSNDERIRRKCSSGGIGFEIGRQLIERGYKAVGCRYDIEKQRAEHYIATTVEDYVQAIGSKYIQSYTVNAFTQIKRRGEKYLVTGTPCQIDSFRRMIRTFRCEENFILLDFFCHCVPSMHVWKAYLKMLEPKIGKINYATWRNKFNFGWHDSWVMGMDGEKTYSPTASDGDLNTLLKEKDTHIKSRMSQGDSFYKLFLGDLALGPQCDKHCKYKYDKSSADIRIGDLWGETYQYDQKGVSALIAFTEKGQRIIESLQNVVLTEHPFDVVAEGQMQENAHAKELTSIFLYFLRKGIKLDSIFFKLLYNTQRIVGRIHRVFK